MTLEPEPDDAALIEVPPTPDEIAALLQVEHLLDQRWPETKIEPSLDRIAALMDLLGSPQRSYPSIHIAGTNGKTSVARMVDALLTALQRRTGRTTSPHLQSAVERIAIDGKPISSVEVSDTHKPKQLEDFDNKRVKIAGKVVYRHGVETGVQSYIEITTRSRRTLFGAGMHPNIVTASLLAVLSAVNRAIAQGALERRGDAVRTGT